VSRSDRIALALLAAVMLLTAATLMASYDKRLINPDTIQLVDATRHLLAGEGFSSSIIYYESQLQFGRVPAPLTVWPPGFSWLLYLPMKFGFSGEATAFVLCAAAHLATALLMFIVARRFAGMWIASIAASAWLLHASAQTIVLALYAEPLYIVFMVASYAALVQAGKESEWPLRWLLVAGLAAACSILMRYSGVLWPAAAGLWLLVTALRTRTWQPIRAAIFFGALPALTTLGLFWRNYLLSGRLSGGQFEYGGPGSIVIVAQHLFWESNVVLGRLLRLWPVVFVIVLGVLGLAALLLIRRLRVGETRNVAIGLAVANLVVQGAFLVASAIESSIVFAGYRYWLPLLPFLAILLSAVASDAVAAVRARSELSKALWPVAIAASVALLAVSSSAELALRWPIRTAHPTMEILEQGLAERLPDGRTVRDVLESSSDSGKPLLGYLEHRLSMQTGRAVIGLTDARYTGRTWTDAEVKRLVEVEGVEQVVFFPRAFDPKHPDNANQPFWDDLLAGQVPSWLRPRYVSGDIALYDVVASELR
jgi:hypothetical protein